jgi:hypothetical protein
LELLVGISEGSLLLLGANELEGATARLGEALLDGFELQDGIPEGVIEESVFDPSLGVKPGIKLGAELVEGFTDGKTEGTMDGRLLVDGSEETLGALDGAMLAVG